MRSKLCLWFLSATIVPASAQSLAPRVIAAGGGVFTQQNLSLSFTIGEVATATLAAETAQLTEGFQQSDPVKQDVRSDAPAVPADNIYPLPASSRVSIALPAGPSAVRVVSVLGEEMNATITVDGARNRVVIDVAHLVPGRYVCESRYRDGNSIRVVRSVFVVAR